MSASPTRHDPTETANGNLWSDDPTESEDGLLTNLASLASSIASNRVPSASPAGETGEGWREHSRQSGRRKAKSAGFVKAW